MDFYGDNVRVARVFRGLSQRELAKQVSASEATVWHVERGRKPNDIMLKALTLVLGVDTEFFDHPIDEEFSEDECNFRRRVSATEKLRKRVLARGTLFGLVAQELGKLLALPKYDIPHMPALTGKEIEDVAARCREKWGLGRDSPIVHMGRVLENAGVMITRLDAQSSKLDAFSRRSALGGMSFVVLTGSGSSATRIRYDMAHELGHLVLHDTRKMPLKLKEDQANRFAAAFLMPRHGFANEFWGGPRGIDWNRLFELKQRWKVSLQAMIYRAYELEIIDAVQFQRAYKTISVRKWRKAEPHEPEPERPELFAKAMRTLWEKKRIGASEVASKLHWTVQMFEDVTGLRSVEPAPKHEQNTTSLSLLPGGAQRKVAGGRR